MAGAKHPEELHEPGADVCLVSLATSDLARVISRRAPQVSVLVNEKHRSQRLGCHGGQRHTFL